MHTGPAATEALESLESLLDARAISAQQRLGQLDHEVPVALRGVTQRHRDPD